jgi:hypothetical protein
MFRAPELTDLINSIAQAIEIGGNSRPDAFLARSWRLARTRQAL